MLQFLTGPFALFALLAFVALALLRGSVGFIRRPQGDTGASLDLDGIEDLGEADGGDGGPPDYEDFAAALRSYVLPLRQSHPDWERLDGAVGIPGRAAFRFHRNGIRFEVNGATLFAPLLAAQTWMEASPGEDPFEVQSTGRVGRLRLRQEIWRDAGDVRVTTN